jgi:hypothetical protein
MPALVAGIHVLRRESYPKTWMAGTSPAMTKIVEAHGNGLLFRSHEREGFAPDLPGAYFDSMPKTVHHFNNIRQWETETNR